MRFIRCKCYHNLRFRQVPAFGNGVIRTFANNTSEMKRLAARDFEDILQVFSALSDYLLPSLLIALR